MSTAHNVITGRDARTNDTAEQLWDVLVRQWGLPLKETKDGVLADLSEAREMASDPEKAEEAFGHRHAPLAAAYATENYERGQDAAVDELLEARGERSTTPDGERAAIDSSIVQNASPIEVDPGIVNIIASAAPLMDLVQMEAQVGFTAQYVVIDDRSQPVGRTSESDAIDLSSNSDGDFSLGTKTRDMSIYVDRVTLSDFTQRAEDTLGFIDVEETTLGERVKVYSRYTAGEMVYGDPDVAKSDGSIQDSNAAPGLARIAQDADTNNTGSADNVVDKSGVSGNFLEDLKDELTKLVTNTGASYSDLVAITSPEFYDAVENESNTVVRLSGYDEDIEFGGREISIKQGVPLEEVRAVGRTSHGQFSYEGTGGTGNFDPDPGDVFIFDQSAFRHRQLAPLSTVPLARRGLADEAAMFSYSTNIDKSHGAHVKYLQAYDF